MLSSVGSGVMEGRVKSWPGHWKGGSWAGRVSGLVWKGQVMGWKDARVSEAGGAAIVLL